MSNMQLSTSTLYAEKHRPEVHFTPKENWMNDPNGLVYYEGVYHLFYQYNPQDKVWGDIHWGHATSTDLVSWTHKPIALHADHDGLGHVFSGCVVVDWLNTSGFGIDSEPPLVALFTHSSASGNQVQSLAYSTDGCETWSMYRGNPVIANPGIVDFRDPKVLWDERHQHWVMVLAAGREIKFYRSNNLLEWTHFFDFQMRNDRKSGVWECPDLFPLTVAGQQRQKWVLLVSVLSGGPNGGSAMQYFVGDFDGTSFQPDHEEVRWLDYGTDHYAGVTWSDIPKADGRRIMIAWMNNWEYANNVPTDPWRGAMTTPRTLSLIDTNNGLRLAAEPVKEFELLRADTPGILEKTDISEPLSLHVDGQSLDIEITIEQCPATGGDWTLRFYNDQADEILIDFRLSDEEILIDRTKAAFGLENNENFTRSIRAPFRLNNSREIQFRIIKDTSSIELFSADGFSLLTVTYFAQNPLTHIGIMATDKNANPVLRELTIHKLQSPWLGIQG